MRKNPRGWIGLALSLIFTGRLGATVPETTVGQYVDIPTRNVFKLKPPDPVNEVLPAKTPLPRLILTGITSILGDRRALLKWLPPQGPPPDPTKERSIILAEGQRDGDVEILGIDEAAGSVSVRNAGTQMLLTFEKDGAKLPSTPPPPPGLPTPGVALQFSPTNSLNPSLPRNPGETLSRMRGLPTRRPRTAPNAASAAGVPLPNAQMPPPAQFSPPAAVAPGAAATTAAAPIPQDLTPEEEAIVQQFRNAAAGNSSIAMQPGVAPGTTGPGQMPLPQ